MVALAHNRKLINTVAMKEKILDILEKHYHGRNFIESRCADELLDLFNVSGSVCDECLDGSGWYGPDDMIYNCSKCNPKAI